MPKPNEIDILSIPTYHRIFEDSMNQNVIAIDEGVVTEDTVAAEEYDLALVNENEEDGYWANQIRFQIYSSRLLSSNQERERNYNSIWFWTKVRNMDIWSQTL